VSFTATLKILRCRPGQSHQEALIFDTPDDRATSMEIQSGSLFEQ
jgi:hypothetical protein